MKITKQGNPWWIGQKVCCTACGCEGVLELSDRPTVPYDVKHLKYPGRCCPTCGEWIHVPEPQTAKERKSIPELRNEWPDAEITEQANGFHFRFDVIPEQTSKENWTEYCEIQARLRQSGWEISEPVIEHDCISGPLKFVTKSC